MQIEGSCPFLQFTGIQERGAILCLKASDVLLGTSTHLHSIEVGAAVHIPEDLDQELDKYKADASVTPHLSLYSQQQCSL